MATPALIDLSNYDTLLVRSTEGRSGTPDGNVFFDTSGTIEFLTTDDTVNVTYPSGHSGYTDGSPEANPLTPELGLKFEAIYAFENQERKSSLPADGSGPSEDLRQYDRWTSGTFKFGGAYNFINGRTPSTAADRSVIRGSGWNENNTSGIPLRKYFGNKGLSNIEATSQPYYQQDVQGTSADFAKVGQIDEAILVYHDSNGDGTPDTVNKVTYEAVSIRTYGQNHDRKETTNDLGIAELGGYSTGFALNESVHLTTSEGSHPYADVYTSPAGVWANMQLEHYAAPSAKTGEFSDETGVRTFEWELANDDGANLDECVAWLDAWSANAVEADGLGVNTGHLMKDIETWYSYNASGQIVTKSGVDPSTEGLFIQNIPASDQQRVVMTDDGGTEKTYSFTVSVEADVGSVAKGDANAWYHSWYQTDYNTGSAEVVTDTGASEVKGNASSANGSNKIVFNYDHTGNAEDTGAGTTKNCVFLCEGDGGATQAKTLYAITAVTTVAFSCAPPVENNA